MPFKKALGVRSPFAVTLQQQVAAGSLLTTYGLFTNPLALGEIYEFLGADYSYDVVSSSGTMDIRVVPTVTAFTGGASLLNATESLSATARTARKAAITTTKVTRFIKPGSMISMVLAGTLTGLVGLNLTVWLQSVRGIRAR